LCQHRSEQYLTYLISIIYSYDDAIGRHFNLGFKNGRSFLAEIYEIELFLREIDLGLRYMC